MDIHYLKIIFQYASIKIQYIPFTISRFLAIRQNALIISTITCMYDREESNTPIKHIYKYIQFMPFLSSSLTFKAAG